MIIMQGMLFNSFQAKGFKQDDGSVSPPKNKIQLIMDIAGENGTVQKGMVDLSVDELTSYTPLLGKEIQVEIGVFSAGKNNTIFFVKKGTLPKAVTPVLSDKN